MADNNPVLDPDVSQPPIEGLSPQPENNPEPTTSEQVRRNIEAIQKPFRQTEPALKPPPVQKSDSQLPRKNTLTDKAFGRFKAGKERFNQARAKAGEIKSAGAAVGDLKDNAGTYAKEAVKEKAGQVAKQAAKQVGNTIKKAAVTFLEKNPYVWVVIGIILLIVVIIAVAVALFTLGRSNGLGGAKYAATAADRQQVTSLLALSGDQVANTQLLTQAVAAEKARFEQLKVTAGTVYKDNPDKAKAAIADMETLITAVDAIPQQTDIAKRHQAITDLANQLLAYGNKYPEILGHGAVSGSYLPVLGVNEGTPNDCGIASVLMVVLYYNPSFTDAAFYDPTARATKSNTACVSPDYISAHASTKDWVYATSKEATMETVKKSLASGDPVVMYSQPGTIYSIQHIFVIVGYDPADNTFLINNPRGSNNGVDLHVKVANGHTMTADYLSAHYGDKDGTYSHSFIIRKKYLQ